MISNRRLYLTADKSRVVEEGDTEAAYLLVGEGGALDDDTAARYGLLPLASGSASKAIVEPPNNKALEVAPAIKRSRGRPKGYSPKKV